MANQTTTQLSVNNIPLCKFVMGAEHGHEVDEKSEEENASDSVPFVARSPASSNQQYHLLQVCFEPNLRKHAVLNKDFA
jgi:hypothetical protein